MRAERSAGSWLPHAVVGVWGSSGPDIPPDVSGSRGILFLWFGQNAVRRSSPVSTGGQRGEDWNTSQTSQNLSLLAGIPAALPFRARLIERLKEHAWR